MRAVLTIALGLAAIAGAWPAAAQDGTGDNQRVCRTPRLTGTRHQPRPICRTRAEWREIENIQRQRLENEGQIFRPERTDSQPRGPTTPT